MWHDGLTIRGVLKLLLASLCAFILSTVIALAIGRYVPKVYGSDTLRPEPGRIYTEQELRDKEKIAKSMSDDVRRQFADKSAAEHFRDLKNHALWAVWLPWLLLPLLIRLKTLAQFLVVLLVPIGGAFLHLVPLEELFLIAIAVAGGALARGLRPHRKHAT